MSRAAVAVLSTENLLHNIKTIKAKVAPAKVIAVVKANAYGHGIRSVSMRLDKYTDMFGVASIDEAEILRQVGITKPILLMEGVFEPSELLIASTAKFHVVFHTLKQLEWLENKDLPLPINAWLKINTGMGRLGFSVEDAANIFLRLSQSNKITHPVRVLSHFACAEEKEHGLNAQQINNFHKVIYAISSEHSFNEYSLCNSAAIFNFPSCYYDYVRPGLSIYGVSPLPQYIGTDLGLKPVMTLQTNISAIQYFKKGATIGYGARYICPRDMIIGIAAFGYGDGYPFSAKDRTPVLVNGVICNIIGRISMDMMTIDLTDLKTHDIGDSVILWGESLPIERIANHTSTTTWNMLTSIQNRVKFLWTHQDTLTP